MHAPPLYSLQVCFVNDGEVGWFVINLCVNLFFFVDLVMNFFMAYQVALTLTLTLTLTPTLTLT